MVALFSLLVDVTTTASRFNSFPPTPYPPLPTMVQNSQKLEHLIIHLPKRECVSERCQPMNERASEWPCTEVSMLFLNQSAVLPPRQPHPTVVQKNQE